MTAAKKLFGPFAAAMLFYSSADLPRFPAGLLAFNAYGFMGNTPRSPLTM